MPAHKSSVRADSCGCCCSLKDQPVSLSKGFALLLPDKDAKDARTADAQQSQPQTHMTVIARLRGGAVVIRLHSGGIGDGDGYHILANTESDGELPLG